MKTWPDAMHGVSLVRVGGKSYLNSPEHGKVLLMGFLINVGVCPFGGGFSVLMRGNGDRGA